jgi:beta-mannosidase
MRPWIRINVPSEDMSNSPRSVGRSVKEAVPNAFIDGISARVTAFNHGWEFAEVPSEYKFDAAGLAGLRWRPAIVPGTVAAALRALGELDEDGGNDLDTRAFVFRSRVRHGPVTSGAALVFDGLATLADVWLDGTKILSARNMFRRYAVDVGCMLGEENELVLHFRALGPELARRRPRGRWTTRLVNHRNLRYVRTTLLGRIPGWSHLYPPVGPWRGVRLVERGRVELSRLSIEPALEGRDGVISIAIGGRIAAGGAPVSLEARLADRRIALLVVSTNDDEFEVVAEMRVPEVAPWWPHNLGTPHRYPFTLALKIGDDRVEIGTVQIGFRRIQRLGGDPEGFALQLNGRDVFCRGACWTPSDAVGFNDDPAEIRRILGLVRDAGMNMLRLSGTTIYESDAFYDACDELGILVWQDFMFASMDYPEDDTDFSEDVREEVANVLARLHYRPCLAVLCGNSEVEQQAAMNGLAPDAGLTPLFHRTLREAGRIWCPGIPYVSSSPTGGALPFHVDAGVAHYFGVGAYLRVPADAHASRVRFASECLAFSNVPEDASLDELFGNEPRAVHSPRYKRGLPRDSGAGWDFADVTDHYIEMLFDCDVRLLRYADTERYLALSRAASGEMMERTLGVWRADGSLCRGALVWFLRDLRTGSGWGVLDSAGRPKAAYWFLKRACAPRAIWFTDEGLNGLRIHMRNDRPDPLVARARVRLLRSNGVEIGGAESELRLDGDSGRSLSVDTMLGRFTDTTYAYRFGPCEHAIVVAEIVLADGEIVATSHHLPMGLGHALQDDIILNAVAHPLANGLYELRVEPSGLALFVCIAVDGFLPADNYFHIPPGGARTVVLTPLELKRPLRGRVTALNARSGASVVSVPGA